MKDFLKRISSLLIALGALLGILFLPETIQGKVVNFLSFLSKGKEAAFAFARYLIQNTLQSSIVLIILLVLSLYAKRRLRS